MAVRCFGIHGDINWIILPINRMLSWTFARKRIRYDKTNAIFSPMMLSRYLCQCNTLSNFFYNCMQKVPQSCQIKIHSGMENGNRGWNKVIFATFWMEKILRVKDEKLLREKKFGIKLESILPNLFLHVFICSMLRLSVSSIWKQLHLLWTGRVQ